MVQMICVSRGIKVLIWSFVLCQILTFHIWIFTKVEMIAFNFWKKLIVWSWRCSVFLSVLILKLSSSNKFTSSNVKRRLKASIINRLGRHKTSSFNWFTSSIVRCVVLIWIFSENKIWFLKVLLLFFIRNWFLIICSSRNTLFYHRMWSKLKMSCS